MILWGHSFLSNLAFNPSYKSHGLSSNEHIPFITEMPLTEYFLLRKISKEENEMILTFIKWLENNFSHKIQSTKPI